MFKVTLIVKFVARTKRDQSSEVLMKQDNSLGSNMLKFYSAEVAELADAQRSERCPALRGGGSIPLFGTSRRGGGTGRHAALRGLCRQRCAGSNPVLGTGLEGSPESNRRVRVLFGPQGAGLP